MNSDLSDMGAAISQSISKDGQTTYTGNQPMGGNKLTGLGDGTASTDSVNLGQVADGVLTYGGVATGSANAIVIAPAPGITTYEVGQMFSFKAAANNTGAVTVNVNGVGAGAVTWPDGSALVADDIVSGGMYEIEVAAATPVFHMQTGANVAATQAAGNSTRKIATTAFVQGVAAKVYVQTFTSSGTYTPHAGMVNCIIECVGGGGGGGGVNGAASNSAASGGGGGGGYASKLATAADIGESKAVTVGAGGAGGSAGANNGSAGGDTSVGSLCIAKGGSGGVAASPVGNVFNGAGGAGGVAGTGDMARAGQPGLPGIGGQNAITAWPSGGAGGSTPVGGGAAGVSLSGAASTTVAGSHAPANTGGGGSGALAFNTSSTAAGGNGSAGFVRITEFCNQ
ncbi:hypothetical protein [Reyranella massiliensis]|uniref:glycine-rich domain-containing protein n=1 Tax=Reyranella massiliensis TaxID=445220 RepID=UPI0002ECC85E|nr:hypothetical protein [Reyranella massiliensis]